MLKTRQAFIKKKINEAVVSLCLVLLFQIYKIRLKSDLNLSIGFDSGFLYRSCIEYARNWTYSVDFAEQFIKENKVKSCLSCKYQPDSWEGDSTNRDALVTFCFSYYYSFVPFVRMIRTTKCKAKIIILCDDSAYYFLTNDIFYQEQRKKCNFYAICLGGLEGKSRSDLYQTKTFVYRDFLDSYGHLFDRILMCDLADTFFQSDPFKPFMHNKAAYCYKENFTLFDEMESLKMYSEINESLPEDTKIVTPAVYFGEPMEVLKLLDMLQTYYFMKNGSKNDFHDQAVANLVYYKKYYADFDIDMRQIDWNEGIISANVVILTSTTMGNTSCLGCKRVPFIIHHPNYIQPLLADFYRHCPRKKKGTSNKEYLYCFGLEEMEKIDKELKEEGLI